jgi:hypothetical protein
VIDKNCIQNFNWDMLRRRGSSGVILYRMEQNLEKRGCEGMELDSGGSEYEPVATTSEYNKFCNTF